MCDRCVGRWKACTSHLAEDEEEESRATAAKEGALGTTKALQPAADRAMQAINPSFMAVKKQVVDVYLDAGRAATWGSVASLQSSDSLLVAPAVMIKVSSVVVCVLLP